MGHSPEVEPPSRRSALAPRAVEGRAWLETGIACAVTLAAVLVTRDGALGPMLRPWFALMPTMVALKHGLVPGGVALLAWAIGQPVDLEVLVSAAFPAFAITAIAGLFRDNWHRSRSSLRSAHQEQRTQLEELFRRYGVLRTSHGELVQRLAARDWSLDTAIREAEQQLAAMTFAHAAYTMLELLVARGGVGAASFFTVAPHARGRPLFESIATVGPAPALDDSERIVRSAFEQATVVTADLASPHAWFSARLNVLVALPVVTSQGQCIGVVGVHELPFDKFNEEQIAVLTTLVLRLADVLAARQRVESVRAETGVHTTRAVKSKLAESQ